MSSVRFAVAGSAPVTVDLLEDFKRVFGVEIIEGYGLTEGGPKRALHAALGDRQDRLRSVCRCPACEVQLRDSSGEREVERGEVGETLGSQPGHHPRLPRPAEVTAERITRRLAGDAGPHAPGRGTATSTSSGAPTTSSSSRARTSTEGSGADPSPPRVGARRGRGRGRPPRKGSRSPSPSSSPMPAGLSVPRS